MSYKEITKFNRIVGNAPHMGTDLEYINQIKQQARLVYEEACELMEAIEAEDFVEVLDAFCDIRYTNEYLDDILTAGGFNVKGAWKAVCENNSQKYTTSYSYALASKEALEEKGTECYIEDVVFEGETYYTVRRSEDQKVMKLKFHERPDISQFVPDEFK